jgi:hypothetical protein
MDKVHELSDSELCDRLFEDGMKAIALGNMSNIRHRPAEQCCAVRGAHCAVNVSLSSY